mmetsp:Transcript_80504/g.145346  ORF Transcript_80504/g.145346 Transcript_80504/m.145346 type:complete len:249 (-) Transcript_80504:224-970(-)
MTALGAVLVLTSGSAESFGRQYSKKVFLTRSSGLPSGTNSPSSKTLSDPAASSASADPNRVLTSCPSSPCDSEAGCLVCSSCTVCAMASKARVRSCSPFNADVSFSSMYMRVSSVFRISFCRARSEARLCSTACFTSIRDCRSRLHRSSRLSSRTLASRSLRARSRPSVSSRALESCSCLSCVEPSAGLAASILRKPPECASKQMPGGSWTTARPSAVWKDSSSTRSTKPKPRHRLVLGSTMSRTSST